MLFLCKRSNIGFPVFKCSVQHPHCKNDNESPNEQEDGEINAERNVAYGEEWEPGNYTVQCSTLRACAFYDKSCKLTHARMRERAMAVSSGLSSRRQARLQQDIQSITALCSANPVLQGGCFTPVLSGISS